MAVAPDHSSGATVFYLFVLTQGISHQAGRVKMSGFFARRRIWHPVLFLICILALPSKGRADEVFVIGGSDARSGLSWEEATGTAPLIDFTARPGGILSREVEEGANIALGMLERGGRVTSPNAQAVLRLNRDAVQQGLDSMVDGDNQTAFEVKDVLAVGVLLILDLGARFGVNTIRFFPRPEFKDQFMKGYVLSLNDGLFGAEFIEASDAKLPNKELFIPVAQEGSNNRDTVDVRFPLQYLRYLRIESTQRFNWEIDEIQFFGRGFVPEAQFLSQPIDLEQRAIWGRLEWATEAVGNAEKSRFTVRTRSGNNASPDEEPEGWSNWSAPYQVSGSQIVSPGPRRYLQFRLDFQSDGLEDALAVDSLSFGLTRPALADAVVGSIVPREVALGLDTTFAYTIEVTNALGFDQIEIDTPAPVRRVRDVFIDGEATSFTPTTRDDGLSVTLEEFSGSGEIQILFDTSVLRYETVFSGRLRDSRRDALPQEIVGLAEEDEVRRNRLGVRVPLGGQNLLHRVAVAPNPFTPNGDGVNDHTTISYDLLYLTQDVPVAVKVYDMAGNRVAALPQGMSPSGRHLMGWDGTGDGGTLLPPGLYVVQVEVDTDSGTLRRSSVVALAY